jgi:hypothetical protein
MTELDVIQTFEPRPLAEPTPGSRYPSQCRRPYAACSPHPLVGIATAPVGVDYKSYPSAVN